MNNLALETYKIEKLNELINIVSDDNTSCEYVYISFSKKLYKSLSKKLHKYQYNNSMQIGKKHYYDFDKIKLSESFFADSEFYFKDFKIETPFRRIHINLIKEIILSLVGNSKNIDIINTFIDIYTNLEKTHFYNSIILKLDVGIKEL